MIVREVIGMRTTLGLLAALLVSACSTDTPGITVVGGTPRFTASATSNVVITAVTDTTITGVMGGTAPITVHVADTLGRALVNQPVTFIAAAGNGSVLRNGAATTAANTNSSGDVVATWKFGATVGEQRLRVTVKNGSDTLLFVATLPTPDALTAVSTTTITGTYGGSTLVSVMAVDSAGDPFPYAGVRFLVGARNGKVATPLVTSNLDGIAKTTWTFDSTNAGHQTLRVTVDGTADTLDFDALVPGPPQPAALVAGGTVTLSGIVGTSAPISVVVVDSHNTPVPNAAVTFTAAAGSGSVVSGTALSSKLGLVYATWVYGTTPGTQRVIATVRGLADTLQFVSTVKLPPTPTYIAATSPTTLTGAAGASSLVTLRVLDGDSVPFANASVRFRILSGGGYIASDVVRSDKNGLAKVTWMYGGRPLGTQRLTAELMGTHAPVVTFTATVTVGAAVAATIVSGNGQIGVAGDTLSLPPTVRVIDNYGNPIPSTTVLCAVTAGGGHIANATTTTNSIGVASCGNWVLGAAAGPNRLNVSVQNSNGKAVANFTASASHP